MEVQILVTVQIDFDDDTPDFKPGDPGEDRMRESAKEAVENALELVENAGFSHDMACIASVGVVACEVFLPNAQAQAPPAEKYTMENTQNLTEVGVALPRLVRRGFERFRFSKNGKTAEREEAWVEIEPHSDLEIDEQRGYDALFAAHPEWGTGKPIKNGIGWSSALTISSPNDKDLARRALDSE